MNHYCCSELLYGTIGTDSMAELKEEDTAATATQLPTAATAQLPTAATATQLPTAATATQLPTAATGDHYRTLSELHHNDRESAPVIMYLCYLMQALLSQ